MAAQLWIYSKPELYTLNEWTVQYMKYIPTKAISKNKAKTSALLQSPYPVCIKNLSSQAYMLTSHKILTLIPESLIHIPYIWNLKSKRSRTRD